MQGKDWSKNIRDKDLREAPSNALFNRLHFSRLKVQGRQVSLAGMVEAKCREKRSTSRRRYSEAREKSAFGDPSYHYFLRPFLRRVAGAGSREARPGRVREARAPLGGSARGGAR